MSLISKWYSTTLVKDTDSQNTPEVDLQDSFEAIEIDIPTIETAELQVKGSNSSGGTFDLIGLEEPVPSSTGGFRTTVPLGGKYQFIKVYLSAAQTSDRTFAVRGISYVSAGLVTLIDRLKNMRIDVGDIEVNTQDIEDGIDELKVLVGEVQATPTSNTILDRIKDLLTGITLAANTGVDIGDVDVLSTAITKTIQTELNIIAAVAADAQDKSSELALTNVKKVAIFIDHARDAAGAFVGAGTEYRVEVSEKASGNDTWRKIASAVCGIAAALGHAMDEEEAAGTTLILIGATTPLVNDIQFFKNATIANSEWGKIVAVVDNTSFTLQDGLTNTQAAITTYSKGEHFVLLLDVEAYTRLRVVCNNNNGTTNQNIVWRCAAITQA